MFEAYEQCFPFIALRRRDESDEYSSTDDEAMKSTPQSTSSNIGVKPLPPKQSKKGQSVIGTPEKIIQVALGRDLSVASKNSSQTSLQEVPASTGAVQKQPTSKPFLVLYFHTIFVFLYLTFTSLTLKNPEEDHQRENSPVLVGYRISLLLQINWRLQKELIQVCLCLFHLIVMLPFYITLYLTIPLLCVSQSFRES